MVVYEAKRQGGHDGPLHPTSPATVYWMDIDPAFQAKVEPAVTALSSACTSARLPYFSASFAFLNLLAPPRLPPRSTEPRKGYHERPQ